MTGPGEADLFAVLGVPRRQDLAPEELERHFHERSRAVHPDRFARATPAERRAALERATELNHAYRTLRDPWRRAEHLLSLLGEAAPDAAGAKGADDGARGEGAGQVPEDHAFLEEQLLAREALATARRRRDLAGVERLRRAAAAALSELERELADALRATGIPATTAPGPGPVEADRARRVLARVRYHQALIADAERALDQGRSGGLP